MAVNGRPKDWQDVAKEAILDYFRNHNAEPFHSDDLQHVIPDEHRGVISLAVMALVNKRLIVGTGVYRKSAIPSRKRSPSQEYRLTELGRDRLVGMGGGVVDRRCSSVASPHSGESAQVGNREGTAGKHDPGTLDRPAATSLGGSAPNGARGSNVAADSPAGGSDSDLTHERRSGRQLGDVPAGEAVASEPEPLTLLPEPPRLIDPDQRSAA